jgi:hypothetical protein
MHVRALLVFSLFAFANSPAFADPSPVPSPTGTGHPYDPCAMASKTNIADATGVVADEVYTAQAPTKNECIWTVGNKTGQPGQQVAMTLQTVDQVKASHGMARFGVLLNAVQNVPGVKMPDNPVVQNAFKDAQVVQGLGDQAGWKNGTLTVLKSHTLVLIKITGGPNNNSGALSASKQVATDVVNHIDTTKPDASPSPH